MRTVKVKLAICDYKQLKDIAHLNDMSVSEYLSQFITARLLAAQAEEIGMRMLLNFELWPIPKKKPGRETGHALPLSGSKQKE